ncbi:MAG: hypothetical protein ACKVP0_17925 [Pirellulaceae bacterium]
MRQVAFVIVAVLLAFSTGLAQEPKKGDDAKPEAVRLRPGTVRDEKGQVKEFEFVRGVRIHPDAFEDAKQLHFWDRRETFIVPISDLASVEIGKQDDKSLKANVVLKSRDGKQQTIEVELGTAVELKWKGEIAIRRTPWRTFQGSTFSFDK